MNPDDKQTTPVPPSTSPEPAIPSAGDDAALKAIEALESESNSLPDSETTPATPDAPVTPTTPISDVTPPPMPSSPAITEPLVDNSSPVDSAATPSTEPVTPATADSTSTSDVTSSDETPAAAPGAIGSFQPFAEKKKSNKLLVVLIIILIGLGLGVGGYFAWQFLMPAETNTPQQTTEDTTDNSTQPAGDAETSVTEEADAIEDGVSGLNDDEFSDDTISDSTLLN